MDENLKIIQQVSKRLSYRYVFPPYTAEDIEQEAIIIGLKALPFYNKDKGPLFSYMWVHINNRLKTFKRDNYYRPLPSKCVEGCSSDTPCHICEQRLHRNAIKRNLAAPADGTGIDIEDEHDFTADIELSEIRQRIDAELPLEMRADYLRMLDGSYVPRPRRLLIEERILSICANL